MWLVLVLLVFTFANDDALQLRPPQRQTPHALPLLQGALERWRSAQQRAEEPSYVPGHSRLQCRLGLVRDWTKTVQKRQKEPEMEERECQKGWKRQGERLQGTRCYDAITLRAACTASHSPLALTGNQLCTAAGPSCPSCPFSPSCRTSISCQETLSGSLTSTGRHSEGSRQVRESHYQGFDHRSEQGLQAGWQSCKTAFNSQRCSSSSQAGIG